MRSPRARLVRGLAGGSCTAALGAVAHRWGGGATPSLAALVALAVIVGLFGVTSVVASRVRWTLSRVAVAVTVAQPLIHVVLGGPTAGHDHTGMSMPPAHAATAGGGGLSMPAMHAVGAVVGAIIVRYGLRWLVLMPACLRAVGLLARRPSRWPIDGLEVPLMAVAGPAAQPPLKSWNSRGPPR